MSRYRGHSWARTLNDEQIATVQRIRFEHNGMPTSSGGHAASHGWRAYMQPTTLPARYLELRHYMTDHKVSFWVIELDGSVSAHGIRGEMPPA